MKAFTNTPITKEKFIQHLKKHKEMDAFEKGHYGQGFEMGDENFKGCAVGCSLRSVALELGINIDTGKHVHYEKYLGVPEWLARVEDRIFEGLPLSRAKRWPIEFGEAINKGAELDKVKAPFLIFVLESCFEYVQDKKFKQQREGLERVVKLWQREDLYSDEWLEDAHANADNAADAHANAAATARTARAAAYVAYYAATARADAYASAYAADNAADARAAAAYAAAATTDASYAARAAAYDKFADKLLELIRECK